MGRRRGAIRQDEETQVRIFELARDWSKKSWAGDIGICSMRSIGWRAQASGSPCIKHAAGTSISWAPA